MLKKTWNRLLIMLLAFVLSLTMVGGAKAQTAYFIDGFHGGVYGGYPVWDTRFIVDMLNKHPDWKINLEIEPETWDWVKKVDTAAYADFKALVADQSARGRIEFINPDYAQSYLYNISGESIIRQFGYGMRKLRTHFPGAKFTTYSSEEPCFTSALPEILTSYGFKYASLKNPNTCFGGYAAAHGGELINWIGPDGTGITTAPRYAMEKLSTKSTWQTIGWEDSRAFVDSATAAGIKYPVAMTIQDAGWKGGPFMGSQPRFGIHTIYTTWRNYFENVAENDPKPDWKPTQEDMLVNLVWGSQVTQKIAQEVRVAENKLVSTEKLAAMAKVFTGTNYPSAMIDSAWRTLLLSQHHDCWIVPYNGRPGKTWADKVLLWTNLTDSRSDSINKASEQGFAGSGAVTGSQNYVRVYNTLGVDRNELVSVDIPPGLKGKAVKVLDNDGQEAPSQVITDSTGTAIKIAFKSAVPSMGYTTFRLDGGQSPAVKGASVTKLSDGNYKIETDLYSILIDPKKGGIIKSLKLKQAGNRELVDKANARGFNELWGNFYNDGGFKSSGDNPAAVSILQSGPLLVRVAIKGTIDGYNFTQVLGVTEGQKRIDLQVNIDWKGNPGIGKNTPPGTYKWQNPHKAFYDDRNKLLVTFPLNLQGQKVYKNAPFDVTESRLENTFYTSWDSIKNNVILNWVDVTDKAGKYGMAMFTDHTTSYTHGEDFPLGLDIQYSGMGLWGKDYKITGLTTVNYALIPHTGKWDRSGIWTAGTEFNEPLVASGFSAGSDLKNGRASFIKIDRPGLEVSSMTFDGNTLLVRVFNAEGDGTPSKITFDDRVRKAALVELNGDRKQELLLSPDGGGKTSVSVSMPRFGFRTIRVEL
jgi:alpha-mannosidase